MAEDEIRKHTKAAIGAIHNEEKGIVEKVKDVLLEVAIIVFAVTISIWFHNLSDKSHERREEREFLTGLKKDIQIDIINIDSSEAFYQRVFKGMRYFTKVGNGEPLNKDSLQRYAYIFFSNTVLQPHTGRFDGLKESGKMDIIENKELLNGIINIHESTLKQIDMLDTYYYEYIQKLAVFIGTNAQLNKPGEIINGEELLRKSQMRFFLSFGESSINNNIKPANADGVKQCKQLIKDIEKELKNE